MSQFDRVLELCNELVWLEHEQHHNRTDLTKAVAALGGYVFVDGFSTLFLTKDGELRIRRKRGIERRSSHD